MQDCGSNVPGYYLLFLGSPSDFLLDYNCVYAQFALEVVNYVENYGLRRKEISPGKYERISVMHSWNAA